MLTQCQLYEAFYKDDDLDIISHDDCEILQLFQVRGILEGIIAVFVNFAGLPLSPETFFPPEQEFEVLRHAQEACGQGLLFDPQSEAMLSCLTKGWLHMEETREGEFKCYFPTKFHNRYDTSNLRELRIHFNSILGSWSTSWESKILGIPLLPH